jgi:hypothetical protein
VGWVEPKLEGINATFAALLVDEAPDALIALSLTGRVCLLESAPDTMVIVNRDMSGGRLEVRS